jgi:hypothetical protein
MATSTADLATSKFVRKLAHEKFNCETPASLLFSTAPLYLSAIEVSLFIDGFVTVPKFQVIYIASSVGLSSSAMNGLVVIRFGMVSFVPRMEMGIPREPFPGISIPVE